MLIYLLAIGCFLLGSVPFGVIFATRKGVDLRNVGSGNVGTTNVIRALGWPLGLCVFALDVLKGVVPVVFSADQIERPEYAVFFGALAVLGHTFSPFLKFRGGKGVATSLGVLLGTAPVVGLAGFSAFLVLFALTRIVSASSLIGSIAVLMTAYFTKVEWTFFVVFGPLVAFVFVRHISNIKRLFKGQEPKLELRKRKENADVR